MNDAGEETGLEEPSHLPSVVQVLREELRLIKVLSNSVSCSILVVQQSLFLTSTLYSNTFQKASSEKQQVAETSSFC